MFLHEGFYYPHGFEVSLPPGADWALLEQGDSALGGAWAVISVSLQDLPVGTSVSVDIRAKAI